MSKEDIIPFSVSNFVKDKFLKKFCSKLSRDLKSENIEFDLDKYVYFIHKSEISHFHKVFARNLKKHLENLSKT